MTNRLQLRIAEKIRETPRAVTITFDLLSGPGHYRAGQFLTFIFEDPHLGEVRRSYSLSSVPGIDARLAITVQQQPNGLISRYFVEQAQVGDIVEALPAAGQFTLPIQDVQARDLFLIGGGSGVVPLFSLLKDFLQHEPRSQAILLLANRDEHSVIFRRQLRRLAADHPGRFHCIHILSSPDAPLAALRSEEAPCRVRWARLSNAMVEELVDEYRRHPARLAQFFLCGPRTLMIKAENALGYLGFDRDQVHREVFTVREPFRPSPDEYPASKVLLHYGGVNYSFLVRPGQTILEAATAAGVELPYSCRSGVCTTCAGRCRQGAVEMFTQEGRLTVDGAGELVLTCVGYPLTAQLQLEM